MARVPEVAVARATSGSRAKADRDCAAGYWVKGAVDMGIGQFKWRQWELGNSAAAGVICFRAVRAIATLQLVALLVSCGVGEPTNTGIVSQAVVTEAAFDAESMTNGSNRSARHYQLTGGVDAPISMKTLSGVGEPGSVSKSVTISQSNLHRIWVRYL